MASAAIVTIGNELVSGDVANTNGVWLAKRLEAVGVVVRLMAVLPDEIEVVAAFLRAHGPSFDTIIVTGGLGGTPDDVTREALAATFGVPQVEFAELTAALRARFTRDPDYVTPLGAPAGGEPAAREPARRRARVRDRERLRLARAAGGDGGDVRGDRARARRRRADRLLAADVRDDREPHRRRLARARAQPSGRARRLLPSFRPEGSRVEVVLKSSDAAALAAAAAWAETALAAAAGV